VDLSAPKTLFLIDGIGAMLTAVSLSLILPNLQWFLMPLDILLPLAAVAGLFAIYSITNYLVNPTRWKGLLLGIAIANTTYCLVTLSLVVFMFSELSLIDKLYFFGEIIIVMTLVKYEISAVRS
jgi:hypothetical protein